MLFMVPSEQRFKELLSNKNDPFWYPPQAAQSPEVPVRDRESLDAQLLFASDLSRDQVAGNRGESFSAVNGLLTNARDVFNASQGENAKVEVATKLVTHFVLNPLLRTATAATLGPEAAFVQAGVEIGGKVAEGIRTICPTFAQNVDQAATQALNSGTTRGDAWSSFINATFMLSDPVHPDHELTFSYIGRDKIAIVARDVLFLDQGGEDLVRGCISHLHDRVEPNDGIQRNGGLELTQEQRRRLLELPPSPWGLNYLQPPPVSERGENSTRSNEQVNLENIMESPFFQPPLRAGGFPHTGASASSSSAPATLNLDGAQDVIDRAEEIKEKAKEGLDEETKGRINTAKREEQEKYNIQKKENTDLEKDKEKDVPESSAGQALYRMARVAAHILDGLRSMEERKEWCHRLAQQVAEGNKKLEEAFSAELNKRLLSSTSIRYADIYQLAVSTRISLGVQRAMLSERVVEALNEATAEIRNADQRINRNEAAQKGIQSQLNDLLDRLENTARGGRVSSFMDFARMGTGIASIAYYSNPYVLGASLMVQQVGALFDRSRVSATRDLQEDVHRLQQARSILQSGSLQARALQAAYVAQMGHHFSHALSNPGQISREAFQKLADEFAKGLKTNLERLKKDLEGANTPALKSYLQRCEKKGERAKTPIGEEWLAQYKGIEKQIKDQEREIRRANVKIAEHKELLEYQEKVSERYEWINPHRWLFQESQEEAKRQATVMNCYVDNGDSKENFRKALKEKEEFKNKTDAEIDVLYDETKNQRATDAHLGAIQKAFQEQDQGLSSVQNYNEQTKGKLVALIQVLMDQGLITRKRGMVWTERLRKEGHAVEAVVSVFKAASGVVALSLVVASGGGALAVAGASLPYVHYMLMNVMQSYISGSRMFLDTPPTEIALAVSTINRSIETLLEVHFNATNRRLADISIGLSALHELSRRTHQQVALALDDLERKSQKKDRRAVIKHARSSDEKLRGFWVRINSSSLQWEEGKDACDTFLGAVTCPHLNGEDLQKEGNQIFPLHYTSYRLTSDRPDCFLHYLGDGYSANDRPTNPIHVLAFIDGMMLMMSKTPKEKFTDWKPLLQLALNQLNRLEHFFSWLVGTKMPSIARKMQETTEHFRGQVKDQFERAQIISQEHCRVQLETCRKGLTGPNVEKLSTNLNEAIVVYHSAYPAIFLPRTFIENRLESLGHGFVQSIQEHHLAGIHYEYDITENKGYYVVNLHVYAVGLGNSNAPKACYGSFPFIRFKGEPSFKDRLPLFLHTLIHGSSTSGLAIEYEGKSIEFPGIYHALAGMKQGGYDHTIQNATRLQVLQELKKGALQVAGNGTIAQLKMRCLFDSAHVSYVLESDVGEFNPKPGFMTIYETALKFDATHQLLDRELQATLRTYQGLYDQLMACLKLVSNEDSQKELRYGEAVCRLKATYGFLHPNLLIEIVRRDASLFEKIKKPTKEGDPEFQNIGKLFQDRSFLWEEITMYRQWLEEIGSMEDNAAHQTLKYRQQTIIYKEAPPRPPLDDDSAESYTKMLEKPSVYACELVSSLSTETTQSITVSKTSFKYRDFILTRGKFFVGLDPHFEKGLKALRLDSLQRFADQRKASLLIFVEGSLSAGLQLKHYTVPQVIGASSPPLLLLWDQRYTFWELSTENPWEVVGKQMQVFDPFS